MSTQPNIAIIGGGAAGFFCAINIKELLPQAQVTIFERTASQLIKVGLSGGGRCNCTNTFADVTDLQQVYPRGYRLLKRLFPTFGPAEARQWFLTHGVELKEEAGGRIFPKSNSSQTIINCLTSYCGRYGVKIVHQRAIANLDELKEFTHIVITTGSFSANDTLSQQLQQLGHEIIPPVPSLFAFRIAALADSDAQLSGTALQHAQLSLQGTKFQAEGPIIVTHEGLSGPAVLKLSSMAARHLAEQNYKATLQINWIAENMQDATTWIQQQINQEGKKLLANCHPESCSARLWQYLLHRAMGNTEQKRWAELSRKDANRLVNTLTNDCYPIDGRAANKDEFVTCGGISLTSVNPSTLESRYRPNLYFAGEVLDIDGITGGFNFQAAWTTAHTVAQAIARAM